MQMTCPKCNGPMRQYERGGVTVDQCTECRGIFLDRGELERLIDAESSWHGAAAPRPPQPQYPQPQYPQPQMQSQYPPPAPPPHYQQQSHGRPHRDYDSDEYPMYGQHGQHKQKKRRGFLEELFD